MLNGYQSRHSNSEEYATIIMMAKITTVFPVSNLWPERGGSAIKG